MTEESDFYEGMQAGQWGASPNSGTDAYSGAESSGPSGLQQAATANGVDYDIMGVKGAPLVSRKDLTSAHEHLQDVMENLIQRQQSTARQVNPDVTSSRAVQMALIGGLGQGSLGYGAGQGLKAAAPLMQHQQDTYINTQDKMDELRLRAAQIEEANQRGLINAQMRGNIYNQQRGDKLLESGYRLGPDGKPVADPQLMDNLRLKAQAMERGKMQAQGLDMFTPQSPNSVLNAPTGGASNGTPGTAMPHAQAIMMAESGGDLNVKPGDGGKAIGPMQLHADAAKEVGVTDRTDPDQNIAGGTAYLDKYTNVFKDTANPKLWATVAYKEGPGFAGKWDGDVTSLSKGTQAYIKKVDGYMGGGLLNGQNPGSTDGEQYLASLRPQVAAQVRAIAEGRMQLPGGFAIRSPYWQAMLQAVSTYDPSFDGINYNARAGVRKDFTSGTSAKSINALNTVAGHLNNLMNSAEALNNWHEGMPFVTTANAFKNWMASNSGDPRITAFDIDKNAVDDEMAKAYKAGVVSDKEKASWDATMSKASTPEQFTAAGKEFSSLLESKINAFQDQYKRGMGVAGKDADQFITPHARQLFSKFEQGQKESNTSEQHDELPDPAKYKGKVATDNRTGEQSKSDGEKWVPLKITVTPADKTP